MYRAAAQVMERHGGAAGSRADPRIIIRVTTLVHVCLLWYLVSHILFAKGLNRLLRGLKSVMSANCHYDTIRQHK